MFLIPRPTLTPFTLTSPFIESRGLLLRDVNVFNSVVFPEPLQGNTLSLGSNKKFNLNSGKDLKKGSLILRLGYAC